MVWSPPGSSLLGSFHRLEQTSPVPHNNCYMLLVVEKVPVRCLPKQSFPLSQTLGWLVHHMRGAPYAVRASSAFKLVVASP